MKPKFRVGQFVEYHHVNSPYTVYNGSIGQVTDVRKDLDYGKYRYDVRWLVHMPILPSDRERDGLRQVKDFHEDILAEIPAAGEVHYGT